jgi:hypothetical protein
VPYLRRLVTGFPLRWPGFETRTNRICGESGTRASFLRVLPFPLPIFPPIAPHSSSIIRGWNNRPNGGRRTKRTQSHHTTRNKKNVLNIFYDFRGSRSLLFNVTGRLRKLHGYRLSASVHHSSSFSNLIRFYTTFVSEIQHRQIVKNRRKKRKKKVFLFHDPVKT